MPRAVAIVVEAYSRFDADDGWAIASHIALSTLMAMFPFFIVLTALAGMFGSADLADEVANLLLAAWPAEVAVPLAREIHAVLGRTHPGVLTLGLGFALFFASSGIESLRIGLNRAYDVIETRNWFVLRLESIGYVLLAALGLLALGFLIVLGPLLFRAALQACAVARAARSHIHVCALWRRHRRSGHRAVRRSQMAAGRPTPRARNPARDRGDARAVAGSRNSLRRLSR